MYYSTVHACRNIAHNYTIIYNLCAIYALNEGAAYMLHYTVSKPPTSKSCHISIKQSFEGKSSDQEVHEGWIKRSRPDFGDQKF